MKNILICVLTAVLGLSVVINYRQYMKSSSAAIEFRQMLDSVSKMENTVTESFPAYDDYPGSGRVERRQFEYSAHMESAKNKGHYVRDAVQSSKMISENKYVSIDKNNFYYFYGVPRENRYLVPAASDLLTTIGSRFSGKLHAKGVNASVKFAVSSALRWDEYQNKLKEKNANAISESSHSYGASFDIFYDDYSAFPDFALIENKENAKQIRSAIAYLAGDSLRRQFKTVMAETLAELQEEGSLYYIYESKQKCFHITVK